MRLGSHVVAPGFCELLCLGGWVPRVASALCCSGPTLVVGREWTQFNFLYSVNESPGGSHRIPILLEGNISRQGILMESSKVCHEIPMIGPQIMCPKVTR
ncbi:hypothetical protein Taro_028608 [Colocasia esculenta]|uniref:Secreted protein n=1 Tax=Colocasia esculenta TaxID=4460 RepID=A0A843VXR7_COLES|nr:hypothetical protein [Colocasia esculenta]